jgi:hypothetical protein
MFGPNWEEVTERWRKLQEYLNDFYCSPNNHCDEDVKEDEIGGACHVLGREENPYRLSARKPEGMTFGRSRHGWGDNI